MAPSIQMCDLTPRAFVLRERGSMNCECNDYHAGDEDHRRQGCSCPRLATAEWGGVWLCDECADAELE